ncbi:MAG: ATP-binding cassette domain-containing protein [Proteobacteria bacterium]|nr:ATP-binding cassette domain-containing protein [Pseudomonadota bacterium]
MGFSLENVSFGYPGKALVLDQASCDFPPGSFTAVTGPSGTGKSTLLRLLCRLEEAQAGVIRFGGTPITDQQPDELRRRAVYIQQTPTVLDGPVRDNLLLPFTFAANSALPRPDDDALRSRLDEFLLHDITLDQSAHSLSVGQKQRLCLIRALLLSPSALLFDEPTSALDPESAEVVVNTALGLRRAGVTVVYVAHDRDLSAHADVATLRLAGGKTERVAEKRISEDRP